VKELAVTPIVVRQAPIEIPISTLGNFPPRFFERMDERRDARLILRTSFGLFPFGQFHNRA